MQFSEFNLDNRLQAGLSDLQYETCTPVQEEVLKNALDGSNLYVQSQTGTGKTCAYLASILQEILVKAVPECREAVYRGGEKDTHGKVLILLPTRELAVQVTEEAKTLSAHTGLKTFCFYGGVGYDKQLAALKSGVDIIVGTPGRMIDLNEGHQLDLSRVKYLVIDEADRMFDMGFYPDLRTLLKVLPPPEARQTMLFSATLNTYVKNLAWEFTRDAKEITIQAENITVDQIDQELLHVSSDDKMRLLIGILTKEKPESVLIFCNTKRTCEVVAKRLGINGLKAEFIIGDLPQKRRLAVMDRFKAGKINILAATDVAARGIDVHDLAMVLNYDLPNEAENYVHRIGRTARAGKSGKAYTFCSEQDVYNLPAIERYIEMSIPSRVASEELMAEDKSKGVYIRTEDWESAGDRDKAESRDRKLGSRERNSSSRGSNRKDVTAKGQRTKTKVYKADNRGQDVGGNKDYTKKKQYTSLPRSPAIDAQELAGLSFEERMKVYREKYGGRQIGTRDKGIGTREKKPLAGAGSRNTVMRVKIENAPVQKMPQKVQANSVPPKKVPDVMPKTVEKKSLLQRVRSLFGKKTRGK